MGDRYINILFTCSSCNEEIEESIFELPEYDYGTDVHSDGRGVEDCYINCPNCEKDYTVTVSNMFEQFEAEIDNDPDIIVDIEVPSNFHDQDHSSYDDYDYEEYLKSYVPDEPLQRYKHSLQLLDEMVAASRSLKSYPMFYRMLLLQHVAMMEAYLCDRLITLVVLDEVRVKLIQGYHGLKLQDIKLVAIASNPNLVNERTNAFLRSQLYHDLDAVDKMYHSALGASPFVNDEDKKFLKSVMINRHHCVHRDGKDNEGAILHDIDESYIISVRDKIKNLVENIEIKFADIIEKAREKTPF